MIAHYAFPKMEACLEHDFNSWLWHGNKVRKEVGLQRKTVLFAEIFSGGNLGHEVTPVVFPYSSNISRLVTTEYFKLQYIEETCTTFDSIGLGYLSGKYSGTVVTLNHIFTHIYVNYALMQFVNTCSKTTPALILSVLLLECWCCLDLLF